MPPDAITAEMLPLTRRKSGCRPPVPARRVWPHRGYQGLQIHQLNRRPFRHRPPPGERPSALRLRLRPRLQILQRHGAHSERPRPTAKPPTLSTSSASAVQKVKISALPSAWPSGRILRDEKTADGSAPDCACPLLAAAKPYNVLVIQTDEHHFKTLGCYGGKIVITPNIDWIAKRRDRHELLRHHPGLFASRRRLSAGGIRRPRRSQQHPAGDDVVTFAEIPAQGLQNRLLRQVASRRGRQTAVGAQAQVRF